MSSSLGGAAYVVGVLWGSVAQLPARLSWVLPRLAPCMCPPIVIEPLLLFAREWERLTLGLICYDDWLVAVLKNLLFSGLPNRARFL